MARQVSSHGFFYPPTLEGISSVPGQVFPGSICAINRSHVMGSINEDGERVETQCEGLSACGIEIGHQDKQQ